MPERMAHPPRAKAHNSTYPFHSAPSSPNARAAHIPLPRIVQANHPEQAVIYGCYYYALDALTLK